MYSAKYKRQKTEYVDTMPGVGGDNIPLRRLFHTGHITPWLSHGIKIHKKAQLLFVLTKH